jgi:hypothetical protein
MHVTITLSVLLLAGFTSANRFDHLKSLLADTDPNTQVPTQFIEASSTIL